MSPALRLEEKPRKSSSRLREFEEYGRQPQPKRWRNNVEIHADQGGNNIDEVLAQEHNIGEMCDTRWSDPLGVAIEPEVPAGRIRATTEVVVSISDRIDWKDDLF